MKKYVLIFSLLLLAAPAWSQTWQNVLTLPQASMSSAFFFNAKEGMIGTGNYNGGALAQIFYTTDGGSTWRVASLPNPRIVGQVNDIYFRTPASGWATIHEASETGWSGIYHTSDRGRTWKLVHQAGFPGGIRETKRGIFYTERDIDQGISFSSDQGKTWRHIWDMTACLAIDFYDDDHGLATSQAYGSPPSHLVTTDGGATWRNVLTDAECWSVVGDPTSKSFILSSEQNNAGTGSTTALLSTTATATTETYQQYYGPFALTGGLAASKGCTTVTYAQVRHAAGVLRPGFLKTTNGGQNWMQIDGPCNKADTRFGVTGRGAVIFAGDSSNAVWRTTNAGGLTPSALPSVQLIATTASTRSALCDSTFGVLLLTSNDCDSLRITNVQFPNDVNQEVSLVRVAHDLSFSGDRDSIVFQYKPSQVRIWQSSVRITLQQADGYTEDTTITVTLIGSQPQLGSVTFDNAGTPAALSFDSVSLCNTEERKITMSNASCFNLTVFSASLSAPFRLRSQWTPFQLGPGEERSFLVEYSPTAAGLQTGTLVVTHDQGTDTLRISGIGYSSKTKLAFAPGTIQSQACDSSTAAIALRNVTCSTLRLLSISNGSHVSGYLTSDTVAAGAEATVAITLTAQTTGNGIDTLHLRYQDTEGIHDTTLVVVWRATSGTPALTLSSALDFGTLSSCSSGVLDSITVTNDGCGDLTIAGSIDDATQGFTIDRVTSPIAPHSSGVVVIRYVPSITGGTATAHLRVHTNAGDSIVTLTATASSSVGSVAILTSSVAATLPCEATEASVSVHNTTCDSLYLISEEITNDALGDFAVEQNISSELKKDQTVAIPIAFSPKDTLTRTATLVLHFRRQDGSAFDTSIALSGFGKSPAHVLFAIPTLALTAPVTSSVKVPVYALNGSSLAATSADIVIAMNTDLLTPMGLVPGRGSWSGATISALKNFGDSCRITLTLPVAQTISAGELFALDCHSFVASRLATNIALQRVTLNGSGATTSACLPTTLALDSVAQFALAPQCGDSTISSAMALGMIAIARITPNPTAGDAVVVVTNGASTATDVVLEVYDAAGVRESEWPLHLEAARERSAHVTLTGPSGVRYIRLSVPALRDAHSATRAVILQK